MGFRHLRRRSGTIAALALLAAVAGPAAANEGFAGRYSGTYSTADPALERGSWCAAVDEGGRVTGTVRSDVTGRNYAVAGTVTDTGGIALSTGQTGGGSSFDGTVGDDGVVEGTWRSDAAPARFHGTFTGGREGAGLSGPPCGAPSALLEVERPALAAHAVAEPLLLDLLDQLEPGRLVDAPG